MKKEILNTIRETLMLREDQVSEDTNIEEIAKDSMDLVELVAVLSNKYKISIKPDELDDIQTVKDIIAYAERNEGSSKSSDTPYLESF